MYYTSRFQLGTMLAERLKGLRGQDVVVVALREQAAMTCVALAMEIRAWVYPFLTEKIYLPGDPRVLGVVDQDGDFCWNPTFSEMEQEAFRQDFYSVIEDKKRQAFSALNQRTTDYGNGALNKRSLNGRVLILVSDIVKDAVEIEAVKEFLKELRLQKLVGAAGNIDIYAADRMHVTTDEVEFMDIIPNMFDDDHYFEQKDSYTTEQHRQIIMNIAAYWK